jgi:ABC-2 type transport system ATP-binding protein
MHSKWRIGWDNPAGGGATCDAVLRIVLAHAELRAVLSMQDAVEARLLAALASNDAPLRRRA